jgi:hypothetical protein
MNSWENNIKMELKRLRVYRPIYTGSVQGPVASSYEKGNEY